MKQKRKFKCLECGEEFEVLADAFLPGVHGTLSQQDGSEYVVVDPTMAFRCVPCSFRMIRELLETQVIDPVELAKEIRENA